MPSGVSRRCTSRVPSPAGARLNDQMTQFSSMRKATSRPGSKRTTSPWVTHSNSRCLLRLVNRAPSTGPPSPLSRTEETCGLHSAVRRTSAPPVPTPKPEGVDLDAHPELWCGSFVISPSSIDVRSSGPMSAGGSTRAMTYGQDRRWPPRRRRGDRGPSSARRSRDDRPPLQLTSFRSLAWGSAAARRYSSVGLSRSSAGARTCRWPPSTAREHMSRERVVAPASAPRLATFGWSRCSTPWLDVPARRGVHRRAGPFLTRCLRGGSGPDPTRDGRRGVRHLGQSLDLLAADIAMRRHASRRMQAFRMTLCWQDPAPCASHRCR